MSDGGKDGDAFRLLLATEFSYAHSFGELAPFFRGLEEGQLLATRCRVCGKAFCPPRLLCLCGASAYEWFETDGAGAVRQVTTTAVGTRSLGVDQDAVFGLIAIDGCSNLLFAHLAAMDEPYRAGARVQLLAPSGPLTHPIQQALFQAELG